jgi:signal transduction histidine kinase
VLLDLMLPGMYGMDVCRRLRSESNVPVVMLTARTLEDDQVRGLELGADDYITKPFSPRQVMARIATVLRRQQRVEEDRVRIGALEVDVRSLRVTTGGRGVDVTPTEARILRTLVEARGRALSREEIAARAGLGDGEAAGDLRSIDAQDRLIAATVPARILRVNRKGERLETEFETRGHNARIILNRPITVTGSDGARLATLLVVPRESRRNDAALRKLNRGLLAIVIAVGVVALLSTALLARSIVRPVERLQHAVSRIEAGDVGHQVEVSTRDELGRLARAFNAMSGELARDRVLRRNLVNDVAHELRTPLTNLICTVEAMQDGLRTADERVLDSLHDDLLLLQRLVDDLQTLSLAEAGTLPLHCEPVLVRELVERFAASQPEAAQSRITIDIPDGLCLNVDRMRFQQILGNLIVNALAHGGPAGRIEVVARALAGHVELAVHDTGPGIAPEHLPHVFDRFYRADPSRARSTGGAGLGLAIVKNLVALHGASIEVESRVGEGSTLSD